MSFLAFPVVSRLLKKLVASFFLTYSPVIDLLAEEIIDDELTLLVYTVEFVVDNVLVNKLTYF